MDFLINGFAGIILGTFVGPIIYSYARKLIRFILIKFNKGLDLYIQDPELRAIIISKMLELQKVMGSNSGNKKMQIVIQTIKKLIPGNIDDIIIEKIAQGIFDEAMTYE